MYVKGMNKLYLCLVLGGCAGLPTDEEMNAAVRGWAEGLNMPLKGYKCTPQYGGSYGCDANLGGRIVPLICSRKTGTCRQERPQRCDCD